MLNSDMKITNKKTFVKGAAKAAATGYMLATPVTEVYLHARTAHRTVETGRLFNGAGWLLTRMTGIDSSPWAISHRNHHVNDSQEPCSRLLASIRSIKKGAVTPEQARTMLHSAENESDFVFPGLDFDSDPAILRNSDGQLDIKYQNKLDKKLSESKYGRLIGFAGLALASYALSSKNQSRSSRVISSAVNAVAFVGAMYAPAFIGSAYPEARDGYSNGFEAGRDGGKVAEALLGNFAMHASHHENPHLFESPASQIPRDTVLVDLLERVGQARMLDTVA